LPLQGIPFTPNHAEYIFLKWRASSPTDGIPDGAFPPVPVPCIDAWSCCWP